MLSTRYRVITKTLADAATGDSRVFSYSYVEPAMNDATHSQVVSTAVGLDETDHLYNPPCSEFRGHAAVRQAGPDGQVTTTFFHQNDAASGRAHTTMVSQEDFYDPFNSW